MKHQLNGHGQTIEQREIANARRSTHASQAAIGSLDLFTLLAKPASIGDEQLREDRKYDTAVETRRYRPCPLCGDPDCRYSVTD